MWLEQGRRAFARPRGHPADEARHLARGTRRVARVDPLGCVGEVEVLPGDQAALLEDLAERTHRRSRIGGRLEDEELALADVLAQVAGGRKHGAEVRVLRRVDRRRHADEDRIGLGDPCLALGRDAEAAAQRGAEPLVGDVVDRRPPGPDRPDARLRDVDPLDLEARLGERDGQGQPDVAEADDGHPTIGRHPAGLLVPATPAGWLVGEPTRS